MDSGSHLFADSAAPGEGGTKRRDGGNGWEKDADGETGEEMGEETGEETGEEMGEEMGDMAKETY